MKSKGSVDFFLGVFLEFGAAFCLLFFLPQVPWHWVSSETSKSPNTSSQLLGATTSQRRLLLRPFQPTYSNVRLSQTVPQFREAPPLLQPDFELAATPQTAAPPSSNNPSHSQRPPFRRDFPRQYRY